MTEELTFEKLEELADTLAQNDKLQKLGLKLKIPKSRVDTYLKTNRINGNWEGTTKMLFDWKENTPQSQQIPDLVKALTESALVALAEEFFPAEVQRQIQARMEGSASSASNANSKSSTRKLTDDEITELSVLLPHGKYSKFCGILGFKFNKHQGVLTKKQIDYPAAYEELLQEWNDEGKTIQDLDVALEKAGLGGLIPQYKK